MVFVKIALFSIACGTLQFLFPDGAWAWGPGVHTVIASSILGDLHQLLPTIARTIQSYPLEYLYGSLAADFFVGRGLKPKEGHSHNWETGFRFLREAKNMEESSYAYGFLSHLAADVIAHNYFIPTLIHRVSTWRRMGHLYWEAASDCLVGPVYMRIAKEVLSMERLGCDDLLKAAVGKKRNGLRARRQLFTQTVKFSDYLKGSQTKFLVDPGLRWEHFPRFFASMMDLSYRLTKDFLLRPNESPCISHDPIGSRNLLLASKKAVLSRLFKIPRPTYRFKIDRDLLDL